MVELACATGIHWEAWARADERILATAVEVMSRKPDSHDAPGPGGPVMSG